MSSFLKWLCYISMLILQIPLIGIGSGDFRGNARPQWKSMTSCNRGLKIVMLIAGGSYEKERVSEINL